MTNVGSTFIIQKVNVLPRLNVSSMASAAAAAVTRATTAPAAATAHAAPTDAAAPTAPTAPIVDSYEQHLPRPTKLDGFADRLLSKVAPIRTHERVLHDISGSFFGVQIGVTFSQLELAKRGTSGVELIGGEVSPPTPQETRLGDKPQSGFLFEARFIQVVNPDGSSNIETVLGRKQLGMGHRIELQGPALNSSLSPGELPVGARFIGVGLTTDVTSTMDHDALSYTVEVKLSEKSIAGFDRLRSNSYLYSWTWRHAKSMNSPRLVVRVLLPSLRMRWPASRVLVLPTSLATCCWVQCPCCRRCWR